MGMRESFSLAHSPELGQTGGLGVLSSKGRCRLNAKEVVNKNMMMKILSFSC